MGKKYSENEKKNAVRTWITNGRNYTKTTKQLKVSENSLRSWIKQYEDFASEVEQRVSDAVARRTGNQVGEFSERLLYTKEQIIERILVLIPQEKSIYTLTGALETLHSIELEMQGGKKPDESVTNLFMQINNQLTQNHGED